MTNYITAMAAFATLLLAGCSRDRSFQDELSAAEPVLFAGSGPLSSRTVVDTDADSHLTINWAAADEVGIYGLSDGRSTGDNYAYVATPDEQDGSRCAFSAKEPTELFKWINGSEQGYYAYYPYERINDRVPTAAAHPFSLPAEQTQAAADSPAHIARYGLMTATPVEIPATETSREGIRFAFANVFSIVELRLRMTSDCSLASVPVKQIRLVSTAADLAIPSGEIDLTQPVGADGIPPVTVDEGSRSVALDFDTDFGLGKSDYTSTYLVVAPGSHPAGALTVEVTAIDNSVNRFTIPESVIFRSNKHYTREYELSLDGFIQANAFSADIPSLTCKAGEPLAVTMQGIADKVDFWSGEEGHDYAYSAKDRILNPMMTMNFSMLLGNGTQRTPVKVKYSTDFDGTMTEAGILGATWTDVSSKFNIPTTIYATDTSAAVGTSSVPTSTGVADCSGWFSDKDQTCYIALFYHIDAYDAAYVDPVTGTAGNGRTYFYLYDMWVRSQYGAEAYTEIYRHKYVTGEVNAAYPTVVLSPAFDSADGTNPLRVFAYNSYPYVIRLGAAFKPAVDKNSYIVLPKLTRPEAKNLGHDLPFAVKGASDEQAERYEYVFKQPGTYSVAVVGTVQTLAGEKQIVKQATVTVTAE